VHEVHLLSDAFNFWKSSQKIQQRISAIPENETAQKTVAEKAQ